MAKRSLLHTCVAKVDIVWGFAQRGLGERRLNDLSWTDRESGNKTESAASTQPCTASPETSQKEGMEEEICLPQQTHLLRQLAHTQLCDLERLLHCVSEGETTLTEHGKVYRRLVEYHGNLLVSVLYEARWWMDLQSAGNEGRRQQASGLWHRGESVVESKCKKQCSNAGESP
ncbi:hypothetical protein K438DRAFT_1770660 [Mycena galopus ATCC 62051]|nr:hypothetical protein K438DRAFT_1770660 [Mycena galopus ATCC 62051]